MRHDRSDPPATAGTRAAAAASLALAAVALVLAVVGVWGDVARLALVAALLAIAIVAGWTAATRFGAIRAGAALGVVAAVVVLVATVLTGDTHGLLLLLVGVAAAGSIGAARRALGARGEPTRATGPTGTEVGPARRGVLIMNPRSGGGKAVTFHLEEEARTRGIEPIVLSPGDDLLQLARDAVARGADVIGVAGGDGTQALVASIAMAADVAVVCVPAGTRNHFALDLGLDRDDVVGALDAFADAIERRIDLATVGDRVFVNNVSLGVYAKIVQSDDYRDAKHQTTAKMLPELLGPEAEPFDLRVASPDGTSHDGAQIVLVSNNPYTFSLLGGFGTRARLDTGELGVSVALVRGAAEAAAAVAAMTAGRPERFGGWAEWTSSDQVVRSGGVVEAGVDGEALLLEPPLVFRSLPGALRVRIPRHAPGSSPAAQRARSPWWSVAELFRVLIGAPSGR